jgi:hypothetical protein
MGKEMKVIGFAQLRNELSNGNLIDWFVDMFRICDKVYIYDQASTDGSLGYYEKFGDKVSVIRSTTNNFENELLCKRVLLQKLLLENPDCDFVFWMDGDTRLDARLTKEVTHNILKECSDNNVDGVRLGHYNMWRSNSYYRLDNSYHNFHDWGRIPLWRNNGKLEFPNKAGLHHDQTPEGIHNIIRLDYNLIHLGFTKDQSIVNRYNTYKSKGQTGPMLDRLIDEEGLWTKRVEDGILPYKADDIDPLSLPKLKDIKRI